MALLHEYFALYGESIFGKRGIGGFESLIDECQCLVVVLVLVVVATYVVASIWCKCSVGIFSHIFFHFVEVGLFGKCCFFGCGKCETFHLLGIELRSIRHIAEEVGIFVETIRTVSTHCDRRHVLSFRLHIFIYWEFAALKGEVTLCPTVGVDGHKAYLRKEVGPV